MKLLNIFRNNQQTTSISHAPEMDLDEQVLAQVNGGHGGHDCYRRHDYDDCHRRHNECYHGYHHDYGCHRSHCH
ncbi:hypothetical protein [Dictyobacter formicarum]|uniref:hypothetical protein n=1 Tax=Dictyobacter formicarum TaxID=2778368 RepID=UPI0019160A4A|nr:hypothetical protein [Dictyobacter formicarum]